MDYAKKYNYATLEKDIAALSAKYNFIKTGVIGESVEGRKLYSLKIGNGRQSIFYNASHHGLEWITSPLLMQFADDYCQAYAIGKLWQGVDITELFEQVTLHLVPMVNPDGIELAQSGEPQYERWQANAHGVDLNHNYDAGFYISREEAEKLGITGPGPTRYGGPFPESEPESHAVANYTRENKFAYVIALHSQGEVIYWKYLDKAPPGAKELGEYFAAVSGYFLDETTGLASYGGYKDWFVDAYSRPGYTVEVGKGVNPLPISEFYPIYAKVSKILLPVVLE